MPTFGSSWCDGGNHENSSKKTKEKKEKKSKLTAAYAAVCLGKQNSSSEFEIIPARSVVLLPDDGPVQD